MRHLHIHRFSARRRRRGRWHCGVANCNYKLAGNKILNGAHNDASPHKTHTSTHTRIHTCWVLWGAGREGRGWHTRSPNWKYVKYVGARVYRNVIHNVRATAAQPASYLQFCVTFNAAININRRECARINFSRMPKTRISCGVIAIGCIRNEFTKLLNAAEYFQLHLTSKQTKNILRVATSM